jgi:hypothetical protein
MLIEKEQTRLNACVEEVLLETTLCKKTKFEKEKASLRANRPINRRLKRGCESLLKGPDWQHAEHAIRMVPPSELTRVSESVEAEVHEAPYAPQPLVKTTRSTNAYDVYRDIQTLLKMFGWESIWSKKSILPPPADLIFGNLDVKQLFKRLGLKKVEYTKGTMPVINKILRIIFGLDTITIEKRPRIKGIKSKQVTQYTINANLQSQLYTLLQTTYRDDNRYSDALDAITQAYNQ